MVIRFLNYTFVSFFSWKQISGFATPHSALQRIIRNIYYGQIMSYYGTLSPFLTNIFKCYVTSPLT